MADDTVCEIWRVVENYPDYEVSNLGRVRSNKRRKPLILTPWSHNYGGYPAVKMSVRGEPQRSTLVHDLVCTAFHGPKPSPKHQVAHWDGTTTNNVATNLRWATSLENCADKVRHGTHINDGQFKRQLTPDDVREIRRLLASGMTQKAIAEKFGIWQTAISHINVRRTWKDFE